MKKMIVMVGLALTMMACGNKTNGGGEVIDPRHVEETTENDEVTLDPEDEKLWNETALEARVNEIYQNLNGEYAKKGIDFSKFDAQYCTMDYLDLCEQVAKAEKGKKGMDRFFLDYRPWDNRLVMPVKVNNVRPTLLTGNKAEVFFDLTDAQGLVVTIGWSLRLENGAWKVHNFHNGPNDQGGMRKRMTDYLEKNK